MLYCSWSLQIPPALAGSPEFPPGDRETIISHHVHKVNETRTPLPFDVSRRLAPAL